MGDSIEEYIKQLTVEKNRLGNQIDWLDPFGKHQKEKYRDMKK